MDGEPCASNEDLPNQVERRALRNKTTVVVCKIFFEDVICLYGCVGKIEDKGELNANEARELFDDLGVNLSLSLVPRSDRNNPDCKIREQAYFFY